MRFDGRLLNRTAFGVVAILMALSGGCYDEGDSFAEDSATDLGAGEEVFAADESKIYFYGATLDDTWSMNSDGSGKTALPAGVWGEPSVALHGGHRWFVRVQYIFPLETDPDGKTRWELFAVRGDGNAAFTVQLTTQADLQELKKQVTGSVRWKPGDAGISWIARRWSGGSVVEGGIYSAEIVFDADGNVTGLAAQPSSPAVAVALDPSGNPNVMNFDWSPDGTQLVHDGINGPIRIANLSGSSQVLVQEGSGPRWSPNGSKIAYQKAPPGSSLSSIYTISPDGSGEKLNTKTPHSQTDFRPIWSPTGTQFVFTRTNFGTSTPNQESGVYRAAVGNTKATFLTGDIGGGGSAFGWR